MVYRQSGPGLWRVAANRRRWVSRKRRSPSCSRNTRLSSFEVIHRLQLTLVHPPATEIRTNRNGSIALDIWSISPRSQDGDSIGSSFRATREGAAAVAGKFSAGNFCRIEFWALCRDLTNANQGGLLIDEAISVHSAVCEIANGRNSLVGQAAWSGKRLKMRPPLEFLVSIKDRNGTSRF